MHLQLLQSKMHMTWHFIAFGGAVGLRLKVNLLIVIDMNKHPNYLLPITRYFPRLWNWFISLVLSILMCEVSFFEP